MPPYNATAQNQQAFFVPYWPISVSQGKWGRVSTYMSVGGRAYIMGGLTLLLHVWRGVTGWSSCGNSAIASSCQGKTTTTFEGMKNDFVFNLYHRVGRVVNCEIDLGCCCTLLVLWMYTDQNQGWAPSYFTRLTEDRYTNKKQCWAIIEDREMPTAYSHWHVTDQVHVSAEWNPRFQTTI